MRRFLAIVVLFVISMISFGNDRNLFYIAEELFYSGELVKANGIYRLVKTNYLSSDELNILYYRLSFFNSLSNSISILSNSSSKESKILQNFLIGYITGTFTNLSDVINLSEESNVYPLLENVELSDNVDILLSIKLYFSLSNFKDKVVISNTNVFLVPKLKFFDSIIFRNLGDEDKSKRLKEEIIEQYPNSFWAYLLSKETMSSQSQKEVELEVGFYILLGEFNEVIKQSLTFKKYNVIDYNGKVYIGPYKTKSEAENEGKKISSTYRVTVSIVQVR